MRHDFLAQCVRIDTHTKPRPVLNLERACSLARAPARVFVPERRSRGRADPHATKRAHQNVRPCERRSSSLAQQRSLEQDVNRAPTHV
jgi:hypothetical protein